MAASVQLDPWNFGNVIQHFPSPEHEQKLQYEALTEFSQGGPVGGPCFWCTATQAKTLVYARCGGPPAWDPTGRKVALPIWEHHWLHGLNTRIAMLDTTAAELTVFAPRFRVLHLQQFDGLLVKGIDSPVYQPKELLINITTTPKKQVLYLK